MSYERRRVFKHDFFAMTALYEGAGREVIVKIHRVAPFLLVPLGWVGRRLALHEAKGFERLSDVAGIPRLIGWYGKTGIVRAYVRGRPLARGERVPDDFHPRLRALIDTMHSRGMAYVDLEKCENVLVGEDGRPYLFDFQIAWYAPRWRGRAVPGLGWLTWLLQNGDRYHLVKLQRRTRPDQLSAAALAASYRRPWYVRLYRVFTAPLLWIRRALLRWIDPRAGRGERGRIVDETVSRTTHHGA